MRLDLTITGLAKALPYSWNRAGAEHPGNRNAVIVSLTHVRAHRSCRLQRWCRGGVRQPGFVTPEALLRILRERKGGTDALGDTGDH